MPLIRAGGRRGCDPGRHAGRSLCRRRRLSSQRVHHRLRRRCPALPLQGRPPRRSDAQDQLTLEWAGVSARYHAAMMRTVVIGEPTNRHRELYSACRDTIQAIEMVLRPGNTFGTVFEHSLEDHGRARPDAPPAERLRLLARRPLLRPPGWSSRCSMMGNPAGDRPRYVAVRPHDHHGFWTAARP